MSELKWEKRPSGWEWRKASETFRAEVCKISGGTPGKPYQWTVHPLPRPQRERWMPIDKGRCRTLTEAKAEADAVIDRLSPCGERN